MGSHFEAGSGSVKPLAFPRLTIREDATTVVFLVKNAFVV